MALIRLDHHPQSLKVNAQLLVALPDPGRINGVPVGERTVLYLLHGLGEDGTAWARHTDIEGYADEAGIVVVMPSAGRSFYCDLPNGHASFTYLTQELPEYLSAVFGLHRDRERTLIAGSSMGGYGAMKAALLRPDLYRAAASFSGVLTLDIVDFVLADPAQKSRADEFAHIFGRIDGLRGSTFDPMTWLRDAQPARLPQLYVSCGLSDELYPLSRGFIAACARLGIPIEYDERPGAHDFDFWGPQARRFIGLYATEEHT